MNTTAKQFEDFANNVRGLCSHISVREDENGPYIFALGLKDTHTLQMRKVGGKYVLELWYGTSAETETVVEEPSFLEITDAFSRAEDWLRKDAI